VSPLRGEKPQNRPLSKRNTGRFALRAMLPVKISYTSPISPEVPRLRMWTEFGTAVGVVDVITCD